MMTKTLT